MLSSADSTSMDLIPAHAGVIPTWTTPYCGMRSYPRARGGDPKQYQDLLARYNLSPRTRG